ncbi:MAG: oxygen-independent coproporphyrinogen III oxidase [Gallionellales bacterium RIFCSPLOWO2_12_FULL_59_22]|nr:MAG: oxygen-independent coproporphyrinogen III oxidase [Gallionellales bacterium RIFCSPLOWO2_02_FULL_59_110]OGT02298.1 MAG: oxygen-independent coproporphyrinogen III oxidase [Gallionellales bacterium RIFCSPLOWO2_02_58_13]OGT14139.1 MAG: oxygen-independent coproporphyrinogen III oxidase [Gallionellales bacterium RIFCSPLOWO2_12_FULL_59_22]
MNKAVNQLVVDLELIRRLDKNGPRYTSYPTADRFNDTFTAESYRQWIEKRKAEGGAKPLSLYIHIPFCNTLCFYCACNKIITKDRSQSAEYVRYLIKEMEMQAALLGPGQVVEQLHFGGGTPTFMSDDEFRQIMAAIRRHFKLVEDGEYSIEIDPRKVSNETIELLGSEGLNRISVGVQDFDAEVQRAVNRIQSEEETLRIIHAARANGFKSVSIDLIYGLPKQTLQGFGATLDKIIAVDPDRLSIYNYAHMPTIFKPQRRIHEDDLPAPQTKLDILSMAVNKLTKAGYVYIGMDHFAKPEDELAVAQRQGRLHRNFQGYSTHSDCDLVALGVSAIGKIGPTYSQNYREVEEYYVALDKDELPIMRGLELNADDLVRREIIQALMCHFEISKKSFDTGFQIDFDSYFSTEMGELREYEQEGLLEITPERIGVTPKGRMLIRNICMAFDKYLRTRTEHARYSKVI